MAKELVEFKPGLRLIGVASGRVNAQKVEDRKSIVGKMTQACAVKVPQKTKWVSVAFRSVDMFFGKGGNMAGKNLKSIYFETTNEDYSKLEKGEFQCDVYALLESDDKDAEWTPFFIIQVLCFGE